MWKSWVPLSLALLLSPLSGGCDATARAGGPTALKEGVNHRVRPGESLFSIAERAYGNGLEWPRIWEANQWLDPDRLQAGELVYLPPRESSWGDPPSKQAYALDPGTGSYESNDDVGAAHDVSANPGNGTPGLHVFRNLATNVSKKTFFGFPLEKVLLLGFAIFLGHAIFQGILVWLAANITFVKDASFKKSMKAVFLTESLTFSTLIFLVGVGILMLYLGTEPGGEGTSTQLFPALESYLRSPVGMGVAAVAVLALYVVLSLRFFPQVFSIPMSRATTLMAIAVLVPHLASAYLVGQRTGWIK